ncbi:hypothetical protein WUBG_17903 [Wuchereria bancrofti]|uniref:SH3 domain-containing protein n=1 Tax=Wuchereria bancrofti TaxID=6293 RepID=J9AB52_WUCBA|nr:hypothetical protein WUBG_17903 [Wuchereria bancrofti]
MYAAYDYDKMQEDELTFSIGTCLRVLEKGTNEQAWWLCEITTTTENCNDGNEILERGLVPRNYLSLYPSLSKRNANFKMFDLSQLPKIHDSKKDNMNVKEWQKSNSMIEKITEKMMTKQLLSKHYQLLFHKLILCKFSMRYCHI